MICILKFAKGHNSVKVLVDLWYLVCPHRLIMLYIGTSCFVSTRPSNYLENNVCLFA